MIVESYTAAILEMYCALGLMRLYVKGELGEEQIIRLFENA